MNREHQSIKKEIPPHEKSFNAIPITVLTKSTAIKNLIPYLHQTNVISSELITWSRAPRVRMSEVAEEQQLHAEGTHFL